MKESTLKEPVATTLPHPLSDLLGFRIVSRGDGACRAELDVRKEHLNPRGLVHGAVPYALAETSMGGALTSMLSEQEHCTTIEIKINYFRQWRSGILSCDTRVVYRGRTTARAVTSRRRRERSQFSRGRPWTTLGP